MGNRSRGAGSRVFLEGAGAGAGKKNNKEPDQEPKPLNIYLQREPETEPELVKTPQIGSKETEVREPEAGPLEKNFEPDLVKEVYKNGSLESWEPVKQRYRLPTTEIYNISIIITYIITAKPFLQIDAIKKINQI